MRCPVGPGHPEAGGRIRGRAQEPFGPLGGPAAAAGGEPAGGSDGEALL